MSHPYLDTLLRGLGHHPHPVAGAQGHEGLQLHRMAGQEAQPLVEAVVTRWANEVMNMGIDVKGLWLIDFDNGSGYYCWQYPEEGLQFFHTYEEGFRGRTRIH